MQKRISGSKKIFPSLINAKPGLTAKEYAAMALDQGLCGSASKDPVFSLATTLMKEVREGRMPDIKVSGKPQRFYPNTCTSAETMKKAANEIVERSLSGLGPVTVVPSAEIAQAIYMLVEVGRFGSRSEAFVWLAQEGVRAKNPELNKVKNVVEQIRQLKNTLPM